jgi:hypothetical protein
MLVRSRSDLKSARMSYLWFIDIVRVAVVFREVCVEEAGGAKTSSRLSVQRRLRD